MQLIHDFEALRKFHGLLGELDSGEVFLVSLDARRKYMSADTKALLKKSDSEMFARQIVTESSFAAYMQAVLSYETERGWYGKDAADPSDIHQIPNDVLAVYAMINPRDAKAAVAEFTADMVDCAFNGGEHTANHYVHAVDRLLSCFQCNRSRRNWIDIDIDIPNINAAKVEIAAAMFSELSTARVTKHVVATRGGYHLLVKADEKLLGVNLSALEDKYNARLAERFPGYKAEIRRTDGLVPVPGTYQGGYPVHFVDPEML